MIGLRRPWAVWAALVLVCAPLSALCAQEAGLPRPQLEPEASTGRSEKSLAVAKKYLISTANPLASEAGREMLRAGGSATDAAIAAQLVLGLVEPQSSGLGGGAFFLHWDEGKKELLTYDGRETAPAAVLAEDPGSADALALRTRVDQERGPRNVVPRLRTRDDRSVTLQFRDART